MLKITNGVPDCTRTPISLALFAFMLLLFSDGLFACTGDRLFHVKHNAPCRSNCVYVNMLSDGKTVELISINSRLSSLIAMQRADLTSFQARDHSLSIPLSTQSLISRDFGLLSGCRYGSIQRGIRHGVRIGDAILIDVADQVTATFYILSVEVDSSFGFYDAQSLKLDTQ